MKHKLQQVSLRGLMLLLAMVWSLSLSAQDGALSGRITDEGSGEGLAGASIVVKGSKRGTTTDANGNFKINAEPNAVLQISSIGFVSKEVTVGNRSQINISLASDNKSLEEVVVVGYGTQKKTSLTGAVSQVTSKEIAAMPVISLTQALQGRVPGVQVTNGSSPGAEPTVRIRGISSISLSSNPLYVIDGVPAGGLNNLDPKDIESLEVLKDASAAAIYGSRASNGVILVTTKKGKAGKLKIDVDSYYGTQSVWRTLDLLNSAEYIQYGTALLTAAGQPVPGRFANMNTPIYNGATTTFAQTDTDWQDVMFRSAPIFNNQISLSGGNENSKFYASLGNFRQEGVVEHTSYNRQNMRLNSEHKVGKHLSFGQTLTVATDGRMAEQGAGGRSMIMNIMRMTPYWPVSDPTKIGGYSTTAQGLDATDPENPMRIAVQNQKNNRNRAFKFLGTVYADVKFTNWLKYRFTAGGDYANNKSFSFSPIYDDGNRSNNVAQVSENDNQFFSQILTHAVTFDKTFGKHSVNALAVQESQTFRSRGISASGQRADNNIDVVQGVSNPNGSTNRSESALLSYVGRINYDFANKYLLSASVRRDGSSKFAPGYKWGTFTSYSAGWRISEEKFMKSLPFISDMKLRASYGETGNNNLGDYDWQPLITANGTLYPFNNTPVQGSYFNRLGNSALEWETQKMKNIGIDAAFLNNRINFSVDVYNRETNGLLLGVPLAPSMGYSANPLANVGNMQNRGVDVSIGYNFGKGDFKSNVTGSFDVMRNKVGTLATPSATINGNNNADFGGFDITRTQAGQPINSFYGWVTDGIFQNQGEIDALNGKSGSFYQVKATAPGDIRFKDLNGDGKITAADRTFIGSYLPKFSYGVNWSGTWKKFDFAVFGQGLYGNKTYNGTKVIGQGMLRLFNATTDVLKAWTPTNTNTDVPRAISGDPNQNTRTSDRFIENGSYFRVKNLSVGYTFDGTKLSKLTGGVLSRTRVYLNTQNLLTLTKYTGFDPEITNSGVDFAQYPQARTVTAGINLSF